MPSRKLWGVVLVALACSGLTNSGFFLYLHFLDNNTAEDAGSRIGRKGVLRLGTSPDYPPFESIQQTPQGLRVVGFDIELAKRIAANMSVVLGIEITLEIEAAFFNALMAGLNYKSYDIVIAAFAIREERALQVDFSIPYYFSQQCCVVAAGQVGITNALDLEGKKIAVQTGTSGEEKASGLGASEVKSFPTVDMMLLELGSGSMDAAIMDVDVANYYFNNGAQISVAFTFDDAPEGFGVAMRKGEGASRVMGIINGTIAALNASGELAQLFNYAR